MHFTAAVNAHKCLETGKIWISRNTLWLSLSKTEQLWVSQLPGSGELVCNLEVLLDSCLLLKEQVGAMIKVEPLHKSILCNSCGCSSRCWLSTIKPHRAYSLGYMRLLASDDFHPSYQILQDQHAPGPLDKTVIFAMACLPLPLILDILNPDGLSEGQNVNGTCFVVVAFFTLVDKDIFYPASFAKFFCCFHKYVPDFMLDSYPELFD